MHALEVTDGYDFLERNANIEVKALVLVKRISKML